MTFSPFTLRFDASLPTYLSQPRTQAVATRRQKRSGRTPNLCRISCGSTLTALILSTCTSTWKALTPTQIDSLIQRTKLPVLIGEYGGGQDIPAHARIARYESAQRLHNRVDILGSFVWALADQGTTDDKRFGGVFDNTGFSQPSYPSTDGETPPFNNVWSTARTG